MNRRPIAARDSPLARATSVWLAPRVSANAISIAGLLCGAGAGLALATTAEANARWLWLGAAALVQLRLLANLLDGMVAERRGVRSRWGELFNEVPDRLSDAATLVGLGCAVGGDVTAGWLAALAALLAAYVRALGAALTGTQHFIGPFAKQQRMAVVTVVALLGAADPGLMEVSLIAGLGLPGCALGLIAFGSALTAWRRLRRIALDLDRRPS